jgi:hypothetical protein
MEMEKIDWITGKNLIERWGIQDFELFGLLKKGLEAYTRYGKTVIDRDGLPTKYSLEQIEERLKNELRVKVGERAKMGLPPPRMSESEIKDLARQRYEDQPSVTELLPKDVVPIRFSIPNDQTKAKAHVNEVMEFRFKLSEAEAFGQQRGLPSLYGESRDGRGETEIEGAEVEKDETLTGRKDILKYVKKKYDGVSWTTIKRWKVQINFPLRHTRTGKPQSSKNKIDSWMNEYKQAHK